ncbi:S8 family serine peptidase [Plantactinospora sp. GCM10030261]|uniref:S8 family serine peptidase n=1 Tax=Plantactinospora sp. GCM10030261 TaxID=3273420 RepID=UPI003607C4A2
MRSGGTGSSPWPVVAAVFVGLWAVAVAFGTQSVGWLVAQVLLVSGIEQPGWSRSVPAVGGAILVAVPAALLAGLPRSVPVRAAGRVWLLGSAALAVLGLVRTIPMAEHEVYLAVLALTAGLAAAGLGRATRRRAPAAAPAAQATGDAPAGAVRRAWWRAAPPAPVGLALTGGLLMLLPWLIVGALGGPLETAFAVAAAAAVGWLAAAMLDVRFWSAYEVWPAGRSAGPALSVLLAGLVAGVALLLIAAGTGQDGTQLAALSLLPPLGVAAGALRAVARRAALQARVDRDTRLTVGLLVGAAVAGPLAFADPEEISLLLATSRDVPFWVAVAASASLVVALLLSLGYGVGFARRRARIPGRGVIAAGTAVALVAGLVGYLAGQPGQHGDRLFVVLRTQADLSGIDATRTGPEGRAARGREVHRRLVEHAERTQVDLRRDLDRLRLEYTPYYLVNGIEVTGGPVLRGWLSRRADVDRVLVSQRLRPLPAAPDPMDGSRQPPAATPWNLSLIGADRVGTELGVNGAGIVVGGADSGVDGTHPELADGFRGGDDSWYDPWRATSGPRDGGGHGTHTLASAVGNRVGVAPGAEWIGCVNLDRNLGNPARYLDCLQFMLAPFPAGGDPFSAGRPDRAPQVLTNSWGCPPIEGCDVAVLRPATDALAVAGQFVVAAAGNTGPRCGSVADPPAAYGNVLTVGAVDRDRRITEFSSRGPAPGGGTKPDLVAPGAAVLSALPDGGYGTLDGTSMATPHVAGVVALMWSANPTLIGDVDRTAAILRDTASPVAPPRSGSGAPTGCAAGPDAAGAGMVDAYAAVRAAG